MNLDLNNKLALVTASSGGIGFEIARSLIREGAKVIVNGRSSATVMEAVTRLQKEFPGAQLKSLAADNGTEEGCTSTIKAFPEVDILVNNLGIYEVTSFFEESDETWQRLFEVNILSGVRLSRHYLHKMLERKAGRIVFISSEAAVRPPEDMASYSATKTMQLSLSRSLANLTKGTQVTVNTVSPGSVKTEGVVKMLQKMYPELPLQEAEPEYMRKNRPTSLIERLIRPEEIADMVTFLCGAKASSVNGAVLRVDGGLVLHII
jgi:3-oxoacyl-[acyl-carrier protein] reductase